MQDQGKFDGNLGGGRHSLVFNVNTCKHMVFWGGNYIGEGKDCGPKHVIMKLFSIH